MILAQVIANAPTVEQAAPPAQSTLEQSTVLISAAIAFLMALGRTITAIKNDGFNWSILSSVFGGSVHTTQAEPNNAAPIPPTPSAIVPTPSAIVLTPLAPVINKSPSP